MIPPLHPRAPPPGYAPQVKAEANANAALGALYQTPYQDFQDPSMFDPGQYAHLGAHYTAAAASAPSAAGPDRNKPRGRAAAAKRTGACARCRRLKVSVASSLHGAYIPRGADDRPGHSFRR